MSMYSNTEIAKNKIELRRLNPDAESLKYVTVCDHKRNGGAMTAYFRFKDSVLLMKSFEDYTGLSLDKNTPGRTITRAYNEALKKEVDREQDRAIFEGQW